MIYGSISNINSKNIGINSDISFMDMYTTSSPEQTSMSHSFILKYYKYYSRNKKDDHT